MESGVVKRVGETDEQQLTPELEFWVGTTGDNDIGADGPGFGEEKTGDDDVGADEPELGGVEGTDEGQEDKLYIDEGDIFSFEIASGFKEKFHIFENLTL